MAQKVKKAICRMLMRCCGLFHLQKKAVFMSFWGKGYSDNPKALYEVMKEFAPDYKYIWLVNDTSVEISGAACVKPSSIRGIYELATAKIWIDNSRKREWIVKRRGQLYIQTWHAGLTVKQVEKDAEDKLTDRYLSDAKHDSQIADYFISGCKWSTELYRKSFWYDGKILELGQPRSDIFYKDSVRVKEKIYKFYSLSRTSHLILYAPTFRADGNTDCYDMDYERVIRTFEKRFGGTWKILIRLHPNIQNKQGFITYNNILLNGSLIPDINELIVSAEVLITDYSSCCFDAMEAGKLVFLYASDVDEYMKDRGTYFDIFNLPAVLSRSNDKLETVIAETDLALYKEKVKEFSKMYGIFNNAQSSENICRFIFDIING